MKKQIIFDFYNTLFNPKSNDLFGGTLPLLLNLKRNYFLTLVTTNGSGRKEQISALGLSVLFDKIVICPIKNIQTFRKLSSGSNLTIVVGDREEEEIYIGKKLGLTTILVNPEKEIPTKTIKNALKKLRL